MFGLFKSKNKEIKSGLRNYDFYKETDVTQFNGIPVFQNIGPKKDRWYIDLPEWQGPKANLEMVAGADTMLEVLSRGNKRINVSFTDSKKLLVDKDLPISLSLEHKNDGVYRVFTHETEFTADELPNEIWLCAVTQFIFGDYPQHIYVSVN